jgi:hypothetical protein
VFQRAQLFEPLGTLPGRRREAHELEKERAPIGVEADVLPDARGRAAVAPRGDRAAREGERVAAPVEADLHAIGVGLCVARGRVHHGRHGRIGGRRQRLDRGIDHETLDRGLIALDVHHHVVVERGGHLGDAVGSRRVVFPGDTHAGSEGAAGSGDPLVVGGDDYLAQALGALRPIPDALDHRAAGDLRQRLAREARGGEAGGDDSDGRHGRHRT